MSLLSWLGIGTAYAATPETTAPAHAAGFASPFFFMLLIVVIFYFLLVRPQQKRAKDHRALVESLNIGDEVMTTSGMIGRITKLRDNYIGLNVGNDIEIVLQRNAIVSVLPKGTIESIH